MPRAPKFDPATQVYVARRRFKAGGLSFKAGDHVPSDLMGVHRMRRLFENRRIYAVPNLDGAGTATPIIRETAPVFAIETSGSWKYVTRNGQKIGRSTQDRDEAEAMLAEAKRASVPHG